MYTAITPIYTGETQMSYRNQMFCQFRKPLLLTTILIGLLLTAACTSNTDEDTSTTVAGTADGVAVMEGDTVKISGSSTVEPISTKVAELFEEVSPDVRVEVDGPGTGDGFKLFCEGETDISNASRPIKETEKSMCNDNGVTSIVELKVGIDGIAVMANVENTAVTCLSFEQLFQLIGPEAEGTQTWAEASPGLPDLPLEIFGPGEESGTFDSFVEIVLEKQAQSKNLPATTRTDYNPNHNDTIIIDGIRNNVTSLGWVGFAFAENAEKVKLLEIDAGTGNGCIPATSETIASNSYPISRDLWIYVNLERANSNPDVLKYVDFYVQRGLNEAVEAVGYVPLAETAQEETRAIWQQKNTLV